MTIFLRGKQIRVKRPPTIDGVPLDEFVERNADPLWYFQNEMYELIDQDEADEFHEIMEDDEPF